MKKKIILRQLPNNNEVKQSADRAKPHATLSDDRDKEVWESTYRITNAHLWQFNVLIDAQKWVRTYNFQCAIQRHVDQVMR